MATAEESRRYYEANKHDPAFLARKVRDTIANRKRNQAMVAEFKAERGCSACSECDPRCLDLHHVDPAQKFMTVSQMMTRSKASIIAELAKCRVLCANCHRKLHRDDD